MHTFHVYRIATCHNELKVLKLNVSHLFQSLSYSLDFDDKLAVTDYKGQEEGTIYVTVTPCNAQGKPLSEEAFVDDPSELLDKPYNFKVRA